MVHTSISEKSGIYFRKKVGERVAKKDRSITDSDCFPVFHDENTESFTDAIRASDSLDSPSELEKVLLKQIRCARASDWIRLILFVLLLKAGSGWLAFLMFLLRFIFSKTFNSTIKYDLDEHASLE